MSRSRLLILGLLSALTVVGAFAQASALATSFWFVNETQLTEGEKKNVDLSGATFVLKSENKTIECKLLKGTGWVENPTGAKEGVDALTEATFSECAVTKPAGCTVTQPIVVKGDKTALFENEGEEVFDKFTPEVAELFTEVKLSGAECLQKGSYKVVGTDSANANGETAALQFVASGSKLKIGTEAAVLEGTASEEAEGGGKLQIFRGTLLSSVNTLMFGMNEDLDITIEYLGNRMSGVIMVSLINENQPGAFKEEAVATPCVKTPPTQLANTATCKIRIKSTGTGGALGKVLVTASHASSAEILLER